MWSNYRKWRTWTSYLHEIYSDPLCGYTFHVVDQPVNDLCTNKAMERQAFLLWEELHTRPVNKQQTKICSSQQTPEVVQWPSLFSFRTSEKKHLRFTQSRKKPILRGMFDGLQDLRQRWGWRQRKRLRGTISTVKRQQTQRMRDGWQVRRRCIWKPRKSEIIWQASHTDVDIQFQLMSYNLWYILLKLRFATSRSSSCWVQPMTRMNHGTFAVCAYTNYWSKYTVLLLPLVMPSYGYLLSPVLLQAVGSPAGWTAAPPGTAAWTPLSAASPTSPGNCKCRRLRFNIFTALSLQYRKKIVGFFLRCHVMQC